MDFKAENKEFVKRESAGVRSSTNILHEVMLAGAGFGIAIKDEADKMIETCKTKSA